MSDTSLVFSLTTRDRTEPGLASARQNMQDESEAMADDVGQAGEGAGSQWGETFKQGAAGVLLGAGAVLAAGLAEAMDQSRLQDKLAAQLALTEEESARVGKIAGDLYADAYGDSFESVNVAIGSVMSSLKGMNDASTSELKSVTAAAMDYASAFEIDVSRAVQVAGTAINAGLAKDATEAFDLITSASQKVPSNLREDLLDSVEEYGQFFRTLGYDGEQAFAVLVDASEKGTFGIDKAGDAIKEFTILATNLDDTGEAYKQIGLDAGEMANAILAGGDSAQGATQKIIDGLLDIEDPAARASASIAFFGAPLEDMNVADIPDFLRALKGASGSMDDFGGSAKRMGDTLNDNAATRIESFKRTVQQNFVEFLGGTVIPAAEEFKDAVGGLWDEAGKGGEEGVDRVLSFLELLAKRLGEKIVEMAPKAIDALVTFGAKVAEYVIANPMQVLQISAIAVALMTAVALLPALIAAALAAAAFSVVVGFVEELVTTTQEKLPMWWDSFTGWINEKSGQAGSTLDGLGRAVGRWFGGLWSRYISGPVGRGWESFLGTVRALPGRTTSTLAGLGTVLATLSGRAWQRFKDAAVAKAASFVGWVVGIPGRVDRAVGNLGGLLYNEGRDIVIGLWNGIKSMGGWLASTLSGWARAVIPGPIARALGIASPSRVMAEVVGRWIPAGVVEGITAGQPELEKTMANLVAPTRPQGGAALAPRLMAAGAARGGPIVVQIELAGEEALKKVIRKIVANDGGGDVQVTFGKP